MRLCTVSLPDGSPFFAIELKGRLLDIPGAARRLGLKEADAAMLADSLTWLQNLPRSEKVLRNLLREVAKRPRDLARGEGAPVVHQRKDVVFHPPVPRPGKFLCVGLNYRDHCEEQNKPLPEFPLIFNKFQTSLLGEGADVPLPLKVDSCCDYEAELGFVIGLRAKNVSKRSAMKHVAGYMIVNDVSARRLQKHEAQWARAKGFDGSGPCGPMIVTADEVPDPHKLAIRCRVNGKAVQVSNTRNLVFGIPELIAYISQAITLEPGDVVSTGTPGGVGVYKDPPVFLKPGDVMQVEIQGLGTLTNRCIEG